MARKKPETKAPAADPDAETVAEPQDGGLDELVASLAGTPAPSAPAPAAGETFGDPDSDKFPSEYGTEEARKIYEDGTIVVVADSGKFSKAPGEGWARKQ